MTTYRTEIILQSDCFKIQGFKSILKHALYVLLNNMNWSFDCVF